MRCAAQRVCKVGKSRNTGSQDGGPGYTKLLGLGALPALGLLQSAKTTAVSMAAQSSWRDGITTGWPHLDCHLHVPLWLSPRCCHRVRRLPALRCIGQDARQLLCQQLLIARHAVADAVDDSEALPGDHAPQQFQRMARSQNVARIWRLHSDSSGELTHRACGCAGSSTRIASSLSMRGCGHASVMRRLVLGLPSTSSVRFARLGGMVCSSAAALPKYLPHRGVSWLTHKATVVPAALRIHT